MDKQITLILDAKQGWLADFNDDDQINELFGCSVLPTPFSAKASPAAVRAEIQRLNPGYVVTIEAPEAVS